MEAVFGLFHGRWGRVRRVSGGGRRSGWGASRAFVWKRHEKSGERGEINKKKKKKTTKACPNLSLVTQGKKKKKSFVLSLSNLLEIRKIRLRKNVYKYFKISVMENN